VSYWRRYPYESASAPTTAEDESVGFRDGDLWYHTAATTLYACSDQETGTWTAVTGGGGGGAVSSVFGRTGAVTALSTDYAAHYQPLDADLDAIAALASTGVAVRTGAGTWTVRTIAGTTDEVAVANGSGVSGAPTIGLASNPTVPGTGGMVIPIGTTAQRGASTAGRLRANTTLGALEYYDGANWVQVSIEPTKSRGLYYYEDFLTDAATVTAGHGRGIETNTGTGAATALSAALAGSGNHPGQVTTTTGTTAAGGATFQAAGSSSIALGGGEWRFDLWFYIPDLSAVAQEYGLLLGFFDVPNAANQVDGAYLLYDRLGSSTGSTASTNWQTVTTAGSTRTFTTSSTAVVEDTWIRATVIVNAAASSVSFLINDAAIVTAHTTNIPTGSQTLGAGWCIKKSAGTTARTVIVDALELQAAFTTPR
jgi:hypothetical protein